MTNRTRCFPVALAGLLLALAAFAGGLHAQAMGWEQVPITDHLNHWGPRQGHAVAVFDPDGQGERLWVLGGNEGGIGMESNEVWSSADGVIWTRRLPVGPIWSPRSGHAALVWNRDGNGERLWVLGGYYDGGFGTFGPRSDAWSTADGVHWVEEEAAPNWFIDSDVRRHRFGAAVFDDGTGARPWVMGGRVEQNSATKIINDVWTSFDGAAWFEVLRYNLNANTLNHWRGRNGHASLVFDPDGQGERLWVLGGGAWTSGDRLRDVWSSPDGYTWTRHTAAAQWASREDHTAVVFDPGDGQGERMWVLGGITGGGGLNNSVWSSATGTGWFQEASGGWSPRRKHASAVFNGRLWVLGGYDGSYLNDVWSYGPVPPPAIVSTPADTAVIGELYAYQIVATGTPTPTIEVTGMPGWMTRADNTLSGTPGVDDIGLSDVITITVSNEHGVATQEFQINVVGIPAHITSSPQTGAVVGAPYAYVVSVQGAPAPGLSAGDLPGWLAFNPDTGELFGTPTSDDLGESAPITISAANEWGEDNQTFTIAVALPPTPQPVSARAGAGGCVAGRTGGLGGFLLLLLGITVCVRRARDTADRGVRSSRRFTSRAGPVFLLSCAAVLAPGLAAQTITVTNLNDSGPGSLRQAIVDSTVGGVIDFGAGITPGVITLTGGALVVGAGKELTIEGPGADELVIDANLDSRVFEINGGANVSIRGVKITRGFVDGHGGGLHISGGASVELEDVLIVGNTTWSGSMLNDRNGGGLYITGDNTTVTLAGCSIASNSGHTQGGGLFVGNGATVIMQNCTVAENTAWHGHGGGLQLSNASLELVSSSVTANAAFGAILGLGGGVYAANGSTITLTDAVVRDNSAPSGGGVTLSSSTATIRNSAIIENTATGQPTGGSGGGLYAQAAVTVTLENVTVAGNEALSGGGMELSGAASVHLGYVTVTDNFCDYEGGGIRQSGGTPVVLNSTLVAANTSWGQGPDLFGQFTTGGHNLIGNTAGSEGFAHGVNNDQAGDENSPLDAMLGELGLWGGSTPTVPLLTGSPAVNTGDPSSFPDTDQRGVPRGALPDVGAFEWQGVTPQITSTLVTTAVVGQHYLYQITASGIPAPDIAVSGLPDWLIRTGNALGGTPGEADIGLTSVITITASNEFGDDVQELQIDVRTAPVLRLRPDGGGGCAGASGGAWLGAAALMLFGLTLLGAWRGRGRFGSNKA